MKIIKFNKKNKLECAKIIEEEYIKMSPGEKYKKGFGLKYLDDKLKHGKDTSFVLIEKNNVVGFIIGHISYWAQGPIGFFEEIVIKEGFRGSGGSQKLYNKLEVVFKKKGVTSIMLWCEKKSRAQSYHLKNGFFEAKKMAAMVKELK